MPAEEPRTAVGGDRPKGSQTEPPCNCSLAAAKSGLKDKRSGALFRSLTASQQDALRAALVAPIRRRGQSWENVRRRRFGVKLIDPLIGAGLLVCQGNQHDCLVAGKRGREAVRNAEVSRPVAFAMYGYAARSLPR